MIWNLQLGLTTTIPTKARTNWRYLSPDGNSVSPCNDGQFELWSIPLARKVASFQPLNGDFRLMPTFAFSPHGRTLAVCDGKYLTFLDTVSGTKRLSFPFGKGRIRGC